MDHAQSPRRELPLQLLAITLLRGSVKHLIDTEKGNGATLCGRSTGINPRYIRVGTSLPNVESTDNANCKKCIAIAETMED